MEVLLAEGSAHDSVLGLKSIGGLPDRGVNLLAAGDVQAPHIHVHRLAHPEIVLKQPLVVRVVPLAEDHRRTLVTGDQQTDFVVGREVHRVDHAIAVTLTKPSRGGVEQRTRGLGIVLAFEPSPKTP